MPFLFFQIIINDYCQKSCGKTILFYNGFQGFLWSSTTSQIFLIYLTTALLKFFKISTEMHFVLLFFLNERNITTSLLMIHLKCAVVHYVSLNSSSINKPYLRAAKCAISFVCFFFRFFNVYLTILLSKTLWKKFFNTNFQNSFQDVVYYKKLGCETLWYQNSDPLNIR